MTKRTSRAQTGSSAAAYIVVILGSVVATLTGPRAGAVQDPAEVPLSGTLPGAPPRAQDQPPPEHECTIDLAIPGVMKDIVSNALLQGLDVPEQDVARFLLDAEERYETGRALLRAAAAHFEMEEAILAAEVERFKHINCGEAFIAAGTSGGGAARAINQRLEPLEVSDFVKDVTLYVVLHEIGHALIREFDIPILGNEETAADAFATYYLTTYMPDRALDVLAARTTSLMLEANETPDVDWTGEHEDDARRAYQIAALAAAADPVKYKQVAEIVGMSEEDISDAQDYGAEIRRSWRRVLEPLWMSEGGLSNEARVLYDPDIPLLDRLCSGGGEDGGGLAGEIEHAVRRFDWHSQVTVHFVEGEGGAGWSRSSRTITVHSGYVRRFIEQGVRATGTPGTAGTPGTRGLPEQSN